MATTQAVDDISDVDQPSPYYEQQPFMGTDRRFYGFISGTGAGKTFAGVYRLVANAETINRGYMGAIIVPDKGMFVDNVKPIMEDFGLLDRWDYNSVYTKEPGLKTQHGDRILILSADNQRQIGRIKGKNLAYVWMDEEAEIDPRAREIAQQRLRVGDYPNLFITTTPDGKNHTYDFFDGSIDNNKYTHGEGTIYETDDRLAIVGVPPEANPVIRDEDIASMRKNLSDQIVAQEIEGQFVELGAGVYTREMLHFTIEESVTKIQSELQPIVAIDPAATIDAQRARENDNDYWAVTVAYAFPRKNKLYVTDTARRRGMTLTEGCEWIGEIVNSVGRTASVVAEANQAQEWLIGELGEYGVYPEPVKSDREKESRLVDFTIPVSNGTIQFVDWNADSLDEAGKNHTYGELVEEMLAFPEGNHDDLLDSLHRCADFAPIRLGANILGADPYSDKHDQ